MASTYALRARKGGAAHLYVAAVGVERPVRIKRDQLQALRRRVHLRAPPPRLPRSAPTVLTAPAGMTQSVLQCVCSLTTACLYPRHACNTHGMPVLMKRTRCMQSGNAAVRSQAACVRWQCL